MEGTVTTSIAGHSGLIVKNATIAIEGTSLSGTTNDAGYFKILDVPDGSYNLKVTAPHFQPFLHPVTVQANTIVDANLPELTPRITGDGNCDAQVDIYDAVKMMESIVGKIDSFDECQ